MATLSTTSLRERMRQDLQLAGLSERTQEAYLGAVRRMAEHFHRPPDQLTEPEVRDYFLYLKNTKQLAAGSLRIAYHGIRFFFTYTVRRDWRTLAQVRIPKPKRLPDVLSVEEVRTLMAAVRLPHYQAYFWTVYSLGLRRTEALYLQVCDIDSGRHLVHVHRGKGAKDRYVPLPTSTLHTLRAYWARHRHPQWLFPALERDGPPSAAATEPMTQACIQAAMRRLVRDLGLRKTITIHTLRHSYATHLLDAGVNLQRIKEYLGHCSLRSTELYLHLTSQGHEQAVATIERVMQ